MQCPQRGLVEPERRFEGAYPSLRLIAEASRIPDPFDVRVVEAYWIGNACLERVARQIEGVGFADGGGTHVHGARESNAVAEAWAARACASST